MRPKIWTFAFQVFIYFFSFTPRLFLAILSIKGKNIPDEVLTDILGFLPAIDLNNDVIVSKKWCKIIERRGKGLDHLQKLGVRFYNHENEPFWMELMNGQKTVHVAEGEETKGSLVLKNGIVKDVVGLNRDYSVNRLLGTPVTVEGLFQKITKLVDQKIPVLIFGAHVRRDSLTHSHANLTSTSSF